MAEFRHGLTRAAESKNRPTRLRAPTAQSVLTPVDIDHHRPAGLGLCHGHDVGSRGRSLRGREFRIADSAQIRRARVGRNSCRTRKRIKRPRATPWIGAFPRLGRGGSFTLRARKKKAGRNSRPASTTGFRVRVSEPVPPPQHLPRRSARARSAQCLYSRFLLPLAQRWNCLRFSRRWEGGLRVCPPASDSARSRHCGLCPHRDCETNLQMPA